MFGFLRYFSIISFVVVILAAYMVGVYFKSIATQDLEALVSNNNISLTQGYINSTWKKHRNTFERLRLRNIPVEKWKNYREFREFQVDTLDYFEDMPVTSLNIYVIKRDKAGTPEGKLILSSVSKEHRSLLQSEEERERFVLATQGSSSSRMMESVPFLRKDGQQVVGTQVQTFVSVLSDFYTPVVVDSTGNQAEAVIEVFFDVTEQWEKLQTFQLVATGGIILIFFVLITVLVFSTRKAEGIISKQHELNLELTATAAEAEAENRDKSQFLANISHELRTPLNAIIGFSEIIKNESMSQMTQQHQEYIRDIHHSGVHLLSLINDILDFSKAEAGKLEVQISEIDAVKMVKNSMRLVIPRAEEAQITLVEDLPEKHFTLQTDAKKLKQVLLNLLSNAVKFTPSGGEVRVSARHNIADDMIEMVVKDSGIGIAPKDISRVMTPFGQVDSTLARKYEGTGLGLPLSKKFVEILGGTFTIESEVDVGTSVIIKLPRIYTPSETA